METYFLTFLPFLREMHVTIMTWKWSPKSCYRIIVYRNIPILLSKSKWYYRKISSPHFIKLHCIQIKFVRTFHFNYKTHFKNYEKRKNAPHKSTQIHKSTDRNLWLQNRGLMVKLRNYSKSSLLTSLQSVHDVQIVSLCPYAMIIV